MIEELVRDFRKTPQASSEILRKAGFLDGGTLSFQQTFRKSFIKRFTASLVDNHAEEEPKSFVNYNSFSILNLTALFTSLPNLKQSSSVSSLCLNNSSNNLIEASFLNSSSTALSATLDHSTSGNSCFTLSGILITTSATSITANNVGNAYIKHFLSKNFFASQKPLQNFWKKFYNKEKQNVPLAKKLDTWFESTKGLRMEGKREEMKEEEKKGVRCEV